MRKLTVPSPLSSHLDGSSFAGTAETKISLAKLDEKQKKKDQGNGDR